VAGAGVGDGGAGPAETTGGPSEVLDLGGFLIERLDHAMPWMFSSTIVAISA
jgi:hypothetical protein